MQISEPVDPIRPEIRRNYVTETGRTKHTTKRGKRQWTTKNSHKNSVWSPIRGRRLRTITSGFDRGTTLKSTVTVRRKKQHSMTRWKNAVPHIRLVKGAEGLEWDLHTIRRQTAIMSPTLLKCRGRGGWGQAVAQLVEELSYKTEDRMFDSWWCGWKFSIEIIDSNSNRNEYQEYFFWGKGGRYVWLTTLPYSCADCLQICEPQSSGTLRVCSGL